jgi:hypothetical protein
VEVQRGLAINRDLLFDLFECDSLVHGMSLPARPFEAPFEDRLGRRNQELKDKALPPFDGQEIGLRGWQNDTGEVELRWVRRLEPFLVEDRERLVVADERKTQVNLPGPEGQRLGPPPVLEREIYVSLLRPASHLVDELRLAGTGRTRHHQLSKLHASRKSHALDALKLLNGDQFQFQSFAHDAVGAGGLGVRDSAAHRV